MCNIMFHVDGSFPSVVFVSLCVCVSRKWWLLEVWRVCPGLRSTCHVIHSHTEVPHSRYHIVILLLFIINKLSVLRPPSRWTWVSRCLLKQRMMEVVVTTGDVSRAKLQSNHHHQQTNTQFFTGRIPFLSPNQQCQSTEGKDTTFPGVASQAHLESSNFVSDH